MEVLTNCVGCGECVVFCPVDAITTRGIAIIDKDICTDCGICAKYCQIDALKNNNNNNM